MKNKQLLIICLIIIFFITAHNTSSQQKNDTEKYKTNPNYNLQISMFEIYKTKQADIVMLGNSLTAGANWSELLGRPNVVARAIPGDILPGFYARLNYIFRLNPKIVFILGGLNDIYNWTPVEEIYYNYIRIITALQTKGIIPVIQSTTYAAKDYAKDFGGTPEINAGRNREVDKLNKLLYEYAKKNKIDYIDINSKLSTGDKFLRPDVTWDGVHLNAEGYKIWAEEVEKILIKYKM
ncbi:GDSL-type esterase/lipase family protein [Ignavibacteria bacterium 4148-Me]|uniref:GDSL-type esterase/lipase family protein n=1 Tax=Rosettibacter primus TaxID=3111523 RepID=UPI00336BFC1D